MKRLSGKVAVVLAELVELDKHLSSYWRRTVLA